MSHFAKQFISQTTLKQRSPGVEYTQPVQEAYDTLITNLPAVKETRSRTVLHVRGVPPDGYVITGWLVAEPPIDEEAEPIYRMSLSGASISVAVPDTGLLLKPVVSPRVTGAASVMVLNAAQYKTDHGIWVSKLFRSPQPWRPLTAHVISRPVGASPILLSVMKDGRDAPEKVEQDNLSTVSITIEDDKMRRLPPGQIQKTRFVRYMVSFEGDAEVSSIAIGSGAQTMKKGALMFDLVTGMGFKGMAPALDDEALSAAQAAFAMDVELFQGVIRPTKQDIFYTGIVNDFDPGTAPSKKQEYLRSRQTVTLLL